MVLDPIARTSEVLFGLIMALTFTNTLSVATAGREEVRTLLFAAIGCNIAWGLVDAVTFLMSALTERGRDLLTIRTVRGADSRDDAYGVIAASVPPIVAATLTPHDFERVRQALLHIDDLPPAPTLTRAEWLGAAGVFLLVFLSTFPIVIPFVVFTNVRFALRMSNLIAIVMLFACGYRLAAHGGQHPWRTGLGVMSVGIVLVAIAIALGG
jgi:VIT1/CCC1 family predicted Fe2+/Mn2+ transporter